MIDELIKSIQSRLLADTTLFGSTPATPTLPYSGLVKGGAYDRKIRREGFGSTPRAYDTEMHVRPTIVILDMEETVFVQTNPVIGASSHLIRIVCLAPAHGAGKVALSQIADRAYRVVLFNDPDNTSSTEPWIPTIQGKKMFPYFSGSVARKDSEEYPQVVEETFMVEYRFIRRHPHL